MAFNNSQPRPGLVISGSDEAGTTKIPESQTGPMDPADPGEGSQVGLNGSFANEPSLTDQLINSGYDPSRAASIAAMMMANSANTPSAPKAVAGTAATPPPAEAGTAAPVADAAQTNWQDVLGYGTGLEIGDTSVHTREVTDDELVSNQLSGLLSSNSKYIRDARLRGAGLANKRGQFFSSFSAAAAEKSAIEAGLPIAVADAQAFRDAAEQNLNALNNFSLANIQRATQIDTSLISANTNITIANLDKATRLSMANLDALTRTSLANLDSATQISMANLSAQTQTSIANSQNQLQLMMQTRSLQHDTGMEMLRQQGAVDLKMLDGALQERLVKYQTDGAIRINDMLAEDRLDLENELFKYDLEKKAEDNKYIRQQNHATAAMQAQTDYIEYIKAYADSDMDAAGAARLQQDAWNNLVAEFTMLNGLYPEFPPITPKR